MLEVDRAHCTGKTKVAKAYVNMMYRSFGRIKLSVHFKVSECTNYKLIFAVNISFLENFLPIAVTCLGKPINVE